MQNANSVTERLKSTIMCWSALKAVNRWFLFLEKSQGGMRVITQTFISIQLTEHS